MSNKTQEELELMVQEEANVNRELTRLQLMKDSAKDELSKLRDIALESFGTSDLEELKGIYKKLVSENEQKKEEYKNSLQQAQDMIKFAKDKLDALK